MMSSICGIFTILSLIEMFPAMSIQMCMIFSRCCRCAVSARGRVTCNPSSILKIVVAMKKINSRNAISAIEAVGTLFLTPCFFLK